MTDDTCATCRWSRVHQERHWVGPYDMDLVPVRRCHLRPPPFPEIRADDFCGEYTTPDTPAGAP